MKKIVISFLLLIAASGMRAQSSLEVIRNPAAGSGTVFVSHAEIIYYVTAPQEDVHTEIDIRNTSSITRYYKIRRFDDVLNNDAVAYFSVGVNHYAPQTMQSPLTLTLTPGETASLQAMNMVLGLIEGSVSGYSSIRYEIFNVNDPSDVFSVTLKYNGNSVSVKEASAHLSASSGVYPNPSQGTGYLDVLSDKDAKEAQLRVTNLKGDLIYEKDMKLIKGKNVLSFEREQLAAGIYLVTISSGTERITRRFTVSR